MTQPASKRLVTEASAATLYAPVSTTTTANNALSAANAADTVADNALTAANAAIPATEKGAANGVATLDAMAKIPSAQIPASGSDPTGANMGTPTTTSSTGTVTVSSTETRDAVLGNYVFTALASRRYRATMDGLIVSSSTTDDNVQVNIRNGGASTPTAASTLIASSQHRMGLNSTAGQTSLHLGGTFVPGAGTVTLSMFTKHMAGTGVDTPLGVRELYVIDIGPA